MEKAAAFMNGVSTARYKMCSIQNVNTLGRSRNKLQSKIN